MRMLAGALWACFIVLLLSDFDVVGWVVDPFGQMLSWKGFAIIFITWVWMKKSRATSGPSYPSPFYATRATH